MHCNATVGIEMEVGEWGSVVGWMQGEQIGFYRALLLRH